MRNRVEQQDNEWTQKTKRSNDATISRKKQKIISTYQYSVNHYEPYMRFIDGSFRHVSEHPMASIGPCYLPVAAKPADGWEEKLK